MGSVSVSPCRCCMLVSCVHPVAVLNAAFCKLFCLDLIRGCFVLSRQKLYVGMVECISWLHSNLCVWM